MSEQRFGDMSDQDTEQRSGAGSPEGRPLPKVPEQPDDRREPGDAAPESGFARPVARGDFWICGEGIHALDDPTPFGQENALQKLGKPPFEKSTRSRFRLLGYLATVYEHVSQDVASGSRSQDLESPPSGESSFEGSD